MHFSPVPSIDIRRFTTPESAAEPFSLSHDNSSYKSGEIDTLLSQSMGPTFQQTKKVCLDTYRELIPELEQLDRSLDFVLLNGSRLADLPDQKTKARLEQDITKLLSRLSLLINQCGDFLPKELMDDPKQREKQLKESLDDLQGKASQTVGALAKLKAVLDALGGTANAVWTGGAAALGVLGEILQILSGDSGQQRI